MSVPHSLSSAVVALLLVTECWAGAARTSTASTASSTREELQAFTELVALEFEERGVRLLPIVVLAGEMPGGDRLASAVPLNDELEIVDAGPIDRCGIYYTPEAIALFEQSDDDPAALSGDLDVAAHELVHCFEFAVAGEAQSGAADSGLGRRGRRRLGGVHDRRRPTRPHRSDVSEWDEFFEPGLDLFARDYDAVGFWSAVHRRAANAMPGSCCVSPGRCRGRRRRRRERWIKRHELSYDVLRRASA